MTLFEWVNWFPSQFEAALIGLDVGDNSEKDRFFRSEGTPALCLPLTDERRDLKLVKHVERRFPVCKHA